VIFRLKVCPVLVEVLVAVDVMLSLLSLKYQWLIPVKHLQELSQVLLRVLRVIVT
jgi:hypothetical protein